MPKFILNKLVRDKLVDVYVATITLRDDDEWVKYYRERPDVFTEKK